MNREDYIQNSVTVRVYEKKLLDSQTFNRLIDSENLEDFKKILSETSYADVADLVGQRTKFDKALNDKLSSMYKNFYKMSKDKEVVEILASQYIFHNLKVIIKSYLLGQDLTDLLIQITDYKYFDLLQDLKENGRATKEFRFKESINAALEEYEESKDPQRLDMTLDTRHNEYMSKLSEDLGSDYIKFMVRNRIDSQNVNMTIRGKKQNHRVNCVSDFMIKGGNIPADLYAKYYFEDTEHLIEVFKSYDIYKYLEEGLAETMDDGKLLHIRQKAFEYIDENAKNGSKFTYGPEVLYSYMLRKEREVQMIRTIAVGKINKLSPEQIRERTGELIA
ncbi:MAG: V-type ATPase subunit [Bacillota bacterium]|nr:V-type ATPase subunit [Bacillota bacterium]